MVTPLWSTHSWFPSILSLCIDYPRLVPQAPAAHIQYRSSGSQSTHSTGCLVHLGKSLRERGVSAEAEELMLSAWSSTNKNYDSAWRKWEDFCNETYQSHFCVYRDNTLLASQFHEGHQYQNIYSSGISSTHLRIDGFEIGKHPMVTRLMKGVFNRRPPLPKYTSTWSVGTVLNYLRSLGGRQFRYVTQGLELQTSNTVGSGHCW